MNKRAPAPMATPAGPGPPAFSDGRGRRGASRRGGVSARAVLIGLALIPFDVYWVVTLDTIRFTGWPTVFSLVFTTVFLFVGVTAANGLVARRWPAAALSRAEMLTIYAMLGTGTAIGGQDMAPTLALEIARPFQFATPENGWGTTILPYLPRWLTVHDPGALRRFYLGNSTLFRADNYRPWIEPLLAWSGFIALLMAAFLCLDVLLRRRWVEDERLAFPLVTLPLALTAPASESLFRNRMMWLGFALAGGIDLINGLNQLLPSVPHVPVKQLFDIGTVATQPPWNALGWTPISLYPFAVGIGFLMPADLSFSCVFFYWVWKLERVARVAVGYQDPDPFSTQQVAGVWMGILAFHLYSARRTYLGVFRKALGLPGGADDSREPLSYRVALAGAVAASACLTAFLMAMGMQLLVALAFVLIYLGLSVVVTRIRCELGPPVHDMYGSGPDYFITSFGGTQNLSHRDMAGVTLLYWINRESYRSHPMPHTMEGLKMASIAGIDTRKLLAALLVAGVAGAWASFGTVLHEGYRLGVAAQFKGTPNWLFSDEVYRRMANWVDNPAAPNRANMLATALGFAGAIACMLAKGRFLWFPLNAAAYTLTYWWTINHLWFGLLVAWLVKVLVFRYGGLKGYRKALPFFIGIILGEFLIGGGWSLIGLLLNVTTYSFQQPG